MKIITQWIIDTFGFSKTEANGTLILIFVTFALAILPRLFLINQSHEVESFKSDQESLDQWAEELESFIVETKLETKPPLKPKLVNQNFPFNPNLASYSELVALGLGEHASKNIVSYRESGGSFKIKGDLRKIYGIPNDRLDELWSLIQLPENMPKKETVVSRPEQKKQIATNKPVNPIEKEVTEPLPKIDINNASAKELQRVQGIGPGYSERIIKYRDKLGGFTYPEQLFEVWGVKEEAVVSLIDEAIFSGEIHKIALNTDSLKDLYRHPYIDYNTAKAIFNYQRQRGGLDSIGQLKEIKIISDSLYQKIYPYLSLHP